MLTETLFADSAADDSEPALAVAPVRARLVREVPALQARELHLLFAVQQELARALHEARPDDLDLVDASAAVGALVGAAKIATAASIARGDDPDQVRAATHRAADIAVDGLRALG